MKANLALGALCAAVLLSSADVASGGSGPSPFVNYQGVLRDSSQAPLDGSFDMVFRFFDAPENGSEILIDEHLAAGSGNVVVSGGLFNVALGSGTVSDGSGPGTFASLGDVFRRLSEVYLEVQIEGETLSPRTRVLSSAYSAADMPADPPCFDSGARFVDCGNGTVTDTATGLIWLKDANCFGITDWPEANEAAGGLADGQCGLTDHSSPGDWRLPTLDCPNGGAPCDARNPDALPCDVDTAIGEFATLFKESCGPPYLPDTAGTGCWTDGDPFVGVMNYFYWSSCSNWNSPTHAKHAHLHDSIVDNHLKHLTGRVWPVRGGR
jgi:hypothetical protein